jgi:hypothetical protein
MDGGTMKTVTGYEPRFDIDLARGKVGEDKVVSILDALHAGKVEVKTDYGSNYTGNLYIEFEKEDRQGNWVPSGIATTEADAWAFAFTDGVIFVDTSVLKTLAREHWQAGHIGQRDGNEHSAGSRGVKMPVHALVDRLRNFR